MPENFYLFCLVILIAAGALSCTVMALDHWLTKADKPSPRHYREARKKERLVEPVAVRKCTVYPEEVMQDGCV